MIRKNSIIVTVLFLFVYSTLFSQDIQKLNIKGYHAKFIDDTYLLLSRNNFTGLYVYSLLDGSIKVLSDQLSSGSDHYVCGNNIYFSTSQGVVVCNSSGEYFRLASLDNSLSAMDVALKEKAGYSWKFFNEILSAKPVNKLEDIEISYFWGNKKITDPIGANSSYLSADISPSGDRILIKKYGGNAFILNYDGEVLSDLGYMEHPAWLNDEEVVYQLSEDDGHYLFKSDIFIYDIKSGRTQNLTIDFEGIALEPSPDPSGQKILFNTAEGELFIINK